MRRMIMTTFLGVITAMTAMPGRSSPKPSADAEIRATLNKFHQAASKPDGAVYFGLFAPEGVFIGTDIEERWTVAEFKKFAEPYFSQGKGWTYVPKSRNIDVAPGGDVAWFDEVLDNSAYGACRGSGVMRLIGKDWKVSQYHLTIPVPNKLVDQVVKMIREQGK